MALKITDRDYETINQSVGAQTMLETLGPMIDRQLDGLIAQLQFLPPELGPLLDARAKIVNIWRMKQRLSQGAARGKELTEVFKQMMVDNMLKEEGE